MPASGGDPVTTALRLSLTASQGSEENTCLDKRLVASSARVLLTQIEYEPLGNCLANVLNHLKNKYIVLRSKDDEKAGTNGTIRPASTNVSVNHAVAAQNGNMKPEPDSILPTPKVTLFPAECVQLGWRGSSHCIGAGMINVGNTCYLNSTLQALFHVPAFVNWLYSDNNHLSNCGVTNGAVSGECIICAMNKTLKSSQSKTNTVIKPFLIYNKLKFICKHLVHGQQEDAHEFMRYLLESMEKAYLNRIRGNKLDSYSKETTPLNQIFGGYIRTEVTCLQCGGISTTFQHCQDLLLDIRRANTLDDALSSYFCKERLDGDDAYRCEQCHKKVSATKKFSMEKPPQVLCIQLKRFSILGGKINKHVSFTQRLDLTRFLCPQSNHRGPVPLTYRLVSMVTHVGSSVHCGHYTAVAQTSTGNYYQFDDSFVRPISLSAMLDTNAYIMMYEREPVPKSTSVSQPSIPSATTTTCALNGQKSSGIRSQPIQGPAMIPVNNKIGPPLVHKPSSANIINYYRPRPDSNSTSISTTYPAATALPAAKDRDRVVFGLHQPAASPATPRLVMHIKNGKVYRPPPQPSPQQQEPSVSTAASSAASLVPYCESGEDESSSSDSEPPPRLWDMPNLDEVCPSVSQSKPVPDIGKVPSKTNSKINFGIPLPAETVSSVTVGSTQTSAASCSSVGKSVQTKKTDLNKFNTSTNSILKFDSDSPSKSGIEFRKNEDPGSQNFSSCSSQNKFRSDSKKTDMDRDSPVRKIEPLLPDKSIFESTKPRKTDLGFPSRSQNTPVSRSKSIAENLDSQRMDNLQESSRNKIISTIRNGASKVRQHVDLASSKEIVNSSNVRTVLSVNVSLTPSRSKYTSGWQVTDQLLHSPSIASESSTSSIANSTTDWAVSDVKQKLNHLQKKTKKNSATCKKSSSDSDIFSELIANSHTATEQIVKDDLPWKKYEDDVVRRTSNIENGDDVTVKYAMKSSQAKKRKDCDDSHEENKVQSSTLMDWTKCKNFKPSSTEEQDSKEYSRKREKKLKKLKKHKKRERSSAGESDETESSKGEEVGFEWVEKTHETLGLNSSYPADTNGHSNWDGARKADVTNHLTNLSHRGYGTSNVTSWSGERSRIDEEVERDRREDRKRSYSSYDEEFDRGRTKKVKHYHTDHRNNSVKYNPFQNYQNSKHQWRNGNNSYYHKPYYQNGKDYHRYNNNHHSHQKHFTERNGYHNGTKYHNHYVKRDRWRN